MGLPKLPEERDLKTRIIELREMGLDPNKIARKLGVGVIDVTKHLNTVEAISPSARASLRRKSAKRLVDNL